MSGFMIDAQGPYIQSAPTDDRDYSLDWTKVLASAATPTDTIATSAWSVPADSGLTLGAEDIAGNVTTVWITCGSTLGEFFVSNTVVSTAGRSWTRGFRLQVIENLPSGFVPLT